MPEAPPPNRWVPLFWPSIWRHPKSLDWITGTPFNCLVLTEGWPKEEPLRVEALRRELTIVDWSKAEASGIAAGEAAKIPWTGPHPIAAITDAVWPGIRMSSTGKRDAADAGPTGAPWIDANGWLVQLSHARAPEKTIWLVSLPHGNQQNIVGENAYKLAVADAAAQGARWLVSLDDQLVGDLAVRNQGALDRWQKLADAIRFFEQRRAWTEGRSQAVVAVISAFSGAGEFLATEVLNLAARRNLLHIVLLAGEAASADFKALRAILYVDADAPAEPLRRKLEAFVRAGGVLIAPLWARKLAASGKSMASPVPGYDVRQLGAGRIAVPAAPWDDPYRVAADAHLLISYREDPVSLFNSGSLTAWYTAAPGGAGELLQLVRYTGQPQGQPVTVRMRRGYSSVRCITLESPAGVELRQTKAGEGVELALPQFGVFAALDLRF